LGLGTVFHYTKIKTAPLKRGGFSLRSLLFLFAQNGQTGALAFHYFVACRELIYGSALIHLFGKPINPLSASPSQGYFPRVQVVSLPFGVGVGISHTPSLVFHKQKCLLPFYRGNREGVKEKAKTAL